MSLESIKERMRKENPAMYQRHYGNVEPVTSDTSAPSLDGKSDALSVTPPTKSTGPSSSYYMSAVASRKKKQDPEDKAISYYINDPVEEESIKVKALKTVGDIADFLDNFNRAGYATVGKLRADVQTFKKMNTPEYQEKYEKMGFFGRLKENLSIEKDKISMAWDGLTREERHTSRDLLRDISPDLVKEAEEKTKFSVFGLDADALSVPLFAADILLDPITYIPFGAPLKAVQYLGSAASKGMKKAATKVLGETAVEALSKRGSEVLVNKVYPHFNLKGVFKHAQKADGTIDDISDIAETAIRAGEVSDAKAFTTYKKIFGKGEKEGWLFKTERAVRDVEDFKEIHRMAAKIEDEGTDFFNDFLAKEMGVAVDDVLKVREVETMLRAYHTAPSSSEANAIIKSLTNYTKDLTGSTAKAVKARLMEDRATKALADKIAGGARDATIDLAKFRLKKSREMHTVANQAISDEIYKIQTSLRSGIKMTGGMLAKDVQDTIGMTRNLNMLAQKAFKGEAGDAAVAMKASVDLLKSKIASLSKYQIDATKVIGKAPHLSTLTASKNVPISRITSVIKDLEADVARMQAGMVRDGGKEILSKFNSSVATINKDLKAFQKESLGGLMSIKGNVKATQQLNDEIVKSTTERLSELMKFQKEISKEFQKELVLKHVTVKNVTKKSAQEAKKLHAAFTSIGSKKFMQKTMMKFQNERAGFLEKAISTNVPKDLQPHVKALFNAYDDFRIRASEMDDPFLTRQNPFYAAPREVEKEFLSTVFDTKNPSRLATSSGHGKARNILYNREYKEFVEKNGGKVEEDAGVLALNYFRKMEFDLGMHQAKQSVMARLGYDKWDDVPGNIKNVMEDFQRKGKRFSANDATTGLIIKGYEGGLNKLKTMLTVMNPAYHGRNFLTMTMQVPRVTGLGSLFNPRNWSDAFLMKAGHKGNVLLKDGSKIPYDDILKFADDGGYLMSSRIRGDIKWSEKQMLGRYSWKNDKTGLKRFVAEALAFSGHSDDYGRLMGAVSGIRNGMSMKEAFEKSRKALGDYNLLNSPADRTIQAIAGFYTFSRRNIEREVVNALSDPKQYKILSSVVNKVSNRENLSDDEWNAVNDWDRGLIKFFGEAVEGAREYTTLGFFPQEEAYATVNLLTHGEFRKGVMNKLNPLIGTALDFLYSKDSFTGKDFGYSLPPKYTALIPEAAREALGLTLRDAPKYEQGVVVGKQQVLYGDPDTIAYIKEFPLWSRQFNDIATLVENINKKRPGKGVAKYLAGFSSKDLSVAESKIRNQKKQKEALKKAAQKKGMPTFTKGFLPKEEKKRAKARMMLNSIPNDDEEDDED